MTKLTVFPIKHLNLVVIRQLGGKDFFLSTDDSIIISIENLSFLLKFLVQNKFISIKVLEGILSECYDSLKEG